MMTIRIALDRVASAIAATSAYFFLLAILYYAVFFSLARVHAITLLEFSDFVNLAIDILSWQLPILSFVVLAFVIFAFVMMVYGHVLHNFSPSRFGLRAKNFVAVTNFIAWPYHKLAAALSDRDSFQSEPRRTFGLSILVILASAVLVLVLLALVPADELKRLVFSSLFKGPISDSLSNNQRRFLTISLFLVAAVTIFFAPLLTEKTISRKRKSEILLLYVLVSSIWGAMVSAASRAEDANDIRGNRVSIDISEGENHEVVSGLVLAYISKGILLRDITGQDKLVRWDRVGVIFTNIVAAAPTENSAYIGHQISSKKICIAPVQKSVCRKASSISCRVSKPRPV
jgi:hypothetical protein